MNKQVLVNWLTQQQPRLEKVLLTAAEEYYNNFSANRTFPYDTKKTGEELWQLSRGADLCYDRPTIGFSYSLWYHPKRINTFLKYFTDLLYEARNEQVIEIFDLGAGTGAVLWAVGLICEGLKENNLPCPKVKVVNVDTSAFMLTYNYQYLWKNFCIEYPNVSASVFAEYKLNSWSNVQNDGFTNVWLCASYLFDHSENHEQITNDFKEIIKNYRPNRVLLLTAARAPKPAFCDKVAEGIKTLDFSDYRTTLNGSIFNGSLHSVYGFREAISKKHELGLSGVPSWNIDSLYGRVLINNKPQLAFDFNKLNLFIQPEKNRKKINLTNEQAEAAKIFDRPTLIIGPAGCGKSVVLTQKIKNILDSTKIHGEYDPSVKILVTTFNKGLVKYLGDWIEQLLDPGKYRRVFDTDFHGNSTDHSYFTFVNSQRVNIYVMHFDVLPTKIGSIRTFGLTQNGRNFELFNIDRMNAAIESYVNTHKIDRKVFTKILDADFLLDEYHRVIYGLECNTGSHYKTIERVGRGNNPQLQYNSVRRQTIWGIISLYLRELQKNRLESFTIRRHRFIKKLRANAFAEKFSHIIVDEFQDCTKADYEIFYQLLSNPNNLTLAGDIAQSINLGSALHIPKSDDQKMARFVKKELNGSFRLPFRVSECIRPLSEKISKKFGEREGVKVDVINPYKGAPPGSRPIFVYAQNVQQAAIKISEIFSAYQSALNLDRASVFERHGELIFHLNQQKIPCETDIILKVKGLEKSCVVWSTATSVDCKTEKEEFVYTILTRTVSLLIILVFPETEQEFIDIIKLLVPHRLSCWDEESEKKYSEIANIVNAPYFDNDVDDSGLSSVVEDDNLDEVIS